MTANPKQVVKKAVELQVLTADRHEAMRKRIKELDEENAHLKTRNSLLASQIQKQHKQITKLKRMVESYEEKFDELLDEEIDYGGAEWDE